MQFRTAREWGAITNVWISTIATVQLSLLTAPALAAQQPSARIPCIAGVPCGPAARVNSDERVKQLEDAATARSNPELWFFVAKYCSEKSGDAGLSSFDAYEYVMRGILAIDHALTMNPMYLEALEIKSTLLFQQAKHERDPNVRRRVVAEAKLYQDSANRIAKDRDAQIKHFSPKP